MNILTQPWSWYVGGVLIGLFVPFLLLTGNKSFGVSSTLRHICAAFFPANIRFFQYDWRKESWNLFFVTGTLIGGFIAGKLLQNPNPIALNPQTVSDLQKLGVQQFSGLLPNDIFALSNILTLKGLVFMVFGGFLIGFGTRYAGGCTSGHAIMGLANLQIPSLIATICFMSGGFVMTHFGLPFIFNFL